MAKKPKLKLKKAKVKGRRKIVGHESAYRALSVARKGKHSVTLIGPSGVGKRTLAAMYPTVECTVLLPCKCGNWQHPSLLCTCSVDEMRDYWKEHASALDADILIEMMPVTVKELLSIPVIAALEPSSISLIEAAYRELHLSPARILRSIKVAETIASLGSSENVVRPHHIAEALQYNVTGYVDAH